MTGAQKSEGGILCAVRNMLTSLRDEVGEVLRKEFESPKNRRSRRGSRRSRIPRNSSLPDSRSQSVPANPKQAASRRRARSSSRGSRRSSPASPHHNHCSRADFGCPGNPIESNMSPLWNSSTEVPEFGRRALPIMYWQPTAARATKSQAATHHKCKSLRRGCADRRCRTEVAPHARFHRRKLRQTQFFFMAETILVKPLLMHDKFAFFFLLLSFSKGC